MAVFHRTELARRFASMALSRAAINPSASGMFLAAPRRTGKSTFLREDLSPALRDLGAVVIYADLWEDRKMDPAAVIVEAIRAELAKHEGVVRKLAKAAGLEKVSVGGLSLAMDRVGLGQGVSLSAALSALSDECKCPIALIIDEAQHAITTEDGVNTLFALKAARDELNSTKHHGLRVIATGSNRDKLAMLRSSRDQAFYCAHLAEFPHLEEDYIEWFCANVELPAPLDAKQTWELFLLASCRPEILGAAAQGLMFDFSLKPKDVAERFRLAVLEQIHGASAELLEVVHNLTPTQSAVLRVMADPPGGRYAPFEAQTLRRYREVLAYMDQQAGGDGTGEVGSAEISVSSVQQALSGLQDKGLAWKAARGVYALEEAQMADVLRQEGMLMPEEDGEGGDDASAERPTRPTGRG